MGRGQAQDPDADRDVQQPRLLQRLGAPDPHGEDSAARRSSAPISAWISTTPDVDFAGLAKSMGWYAEGPIEHGKDVGPALKRAIARVKAGQPALIDTITQKR